MPNIIQTTSWSATDLWRKNGKMASAAHTDSWASDADAWQTAFPHCWKNAVPQPTRELKMHQLRSPRPEEHARTVTVLTALSGGLLVAAAAKDLRFPMS